MPSIVSWFELEHELKLLKRENLKLTSRLETAEKSVLRLQKKSVKLKALKKKLKRNGK
jgi:hypothetical protein